MEGGFEAIAGYMPMLLRGVVMTIALTIVILLFATPLAVGVAIVRRSGGPLVNALCVTAGWFMRGIPPLIILLAVFFIPSSFGINLDPFVSATLAMVAYMTFYLAEVIRGGLLGVPPGQFQAGQALGLSRSHLFRRIILPQTLPTIGPPYFSHASGLLKSTSLASAVAVPELTRSAKEIFSVNFMPIQVLLIAGVFYAVLSSMLFVFQSWLERRPFLGWARR